MDERTLYRELVAWLRSHYPLVLAQWERHRQRLDNLHEGEERLLPGPADRPTRPLDELAPDASLTTVIKALRQELDSLGITGGTPGVTPDGAQCIHLLKKGLYGSAYEESVTLARLRDPGYKRHLREVFG